MRVSMGVAVLVLAVIASSAVLVGEGYCGTAYYDGRATAGEQSTPATAAVEKAVACRAVKDRQPEGEAREFPLSAGRVYIWTLVTGGKGGTIKHVYFLEGRYVQTVELEIRSDWFRTWSYKTIWADCEGNWKVNVTDEDGNILDAVNFVVYKEEEAPPA